MILLIDNYDSFSYNLVQYFGELGATVEICRNDEITLTQIESLNPESIVISPGPRTPNEAGISMDVIKRFAGQLPILGVCLGHQCIAQVFGGSIIHAKQIKHGKVSQIKHSNTGLFYNLYNPFSATRYHSLVVDKKSLPSCFEITAWTQDDTANIDEIMAIKHKTLPLEGVQFHPESILTQQGHRLLQNFLALSKSYSFSEKNCCIL